MHGICVRRNATLQQPRVLKRTEEILELLGGDTKVSQRDVITDDAVLAPGYGQLNDAVMEAITMSAQLEALLLDPVYTGRAMAGLIALARSGVLQQGQNVLFIHTGGLPALFAYENKLAKFAGWS